MNDEIYDDIVLEEIAKKTFGIHIDVDHVIARNLPTSRTARATVFLTKKKQLLVYIKGESRLQLADIKKMIARLGCVAELYIPPKGQPNYFDEIGREKFREVFPARRHPTADDIIYYRTLAPYNPALVQILEVKNGELYQYDTDSRGSWRPAAKFAYRRILTSQ